MLKKRTKDRVVSVRLTDEQYAPHDEIMKRTGVSASAYFRELLTNKHPVFKEASMADERLVFVFNKSSNNLNQVAKRVHQAHHRGIISQVLFMKLCNTLNAIRDLLLARVDRAD
jgi:hypothetical protein